MRVTYASDLHLEFYGSRSKLGATDPEKYLGLPPEGTVLVLAGDVLQYSAMEPHLILWLQKAAERFEHVLWVPGNHENYDSPLGPLEGGKRFQEEISRRASNVTILHRGLMEIRGVTFLGTPLWAPLFRESNQMNLDALLRWPDFRRTLTEDLVKMLPEDWDLMYDDDVQWLQDRFAEFEHLPVENPNSVSRFELSKQVVVVTHNPPTYDVADPKFSHQPGNQMFYAPLRGQLQLGGALSGAGYWISGHTHASGRTQIGPTEVLVNPAGYPRVDGKLENTRFKWEQIVVSRKVVKHD